jgi:hypothetical protein
MLLKKSFCTGDQKFSGPWTRVSCKDVGDLICVKINSLATSVTSLRPHRSAVVGRIFLQQENWRRAIWDFCNNIGT